MAIISTGSFPQDLRPGIRMWFGSAYKIYDTEYDKLLDVKVADDRAYEEDVSMSTLGLAKVKAQGSPVSYDSGNQLYSTRYTHVQYALGFVITEEMMEDGIALKMGKVYSEAMKLNMLRSREIISAGVYINGFTSSAKMDGGDSVCLFNNAHPVVGANQSNVPTSAASISEAGLEQAAIDIHGFQDNRGNLIAVRPNTIVIPKELEFTTHRIMNSVLQNNTADNAINALRDKGTYPGGVQVGHYLTSTTNWFVKTDQPGLNYFNRKDISMSDDNEFDTNNAKFKSLMRLSVGWSDWRSVYGVNA